MDPTPRITQSTRSAGDAYAVRLRFPVRLY